MLRQRYNEANMAKVKDMHIRVVSRSIATVAYERRTRILELVFCNGGVYRYFGVPPKVYLGLLRATSKGRFFNACIRNRYPYARQ